MLWKKSLKLITHIFLLTHQRQTRRSILYADLALVNGKIVTIDERESIEEAIAVKFGQVVAAERLSRGS
jgi:predicted nucleic-acid-binding protein